MNSFNQAMYSMQSHAAVTEPKRKAINSFCAFVRSLNPGLERMGFRFVLESTIRGDVSVSIRRENRIDLFVYSWQYGQAVPTEEKLLQLVRQKIQEERENFVSPIKFVELNLKDQGDCRRAISMLNHVINNQFSAHLRSLGKQPPRLKGNGLPAWKYFHSFITSINTGDIFSPFLTLPEWEVMEALYPFADGKSKSSSCYDNSLSEERKQALSSLLRG